MCCGVFAFGKMQVEEPEVVDREHDGDKIVLPGESGYSSDSGWDNLEEDVEEEDGDAEVGDRDSSGGGDEHQGRNVVTPRSKKARLELEKEVDAELRANGDYHEDSDHEESEDFGFDCN